MGQTVQHVGWTASLSEPWLGLELGHIMVWTGPLASHVLGVI